MINRTPHLRGVQGRYAGDDVTWTMRGRRVTLNQLGSNDFRKTNQLPTPRAGIRRSRSAHFGRKVAVGDRVAVPRYVISATQSGAGLLERQTVVVASHSLGGQAVPRPHWW